MEHEVLEHILDGRKKPTNLELSLLKNITANFSEEREIGKGGFATVYKGVLPNVNVAVKRIMNRHTIDDALFHREVDSLLAVNHQNIVQFLGYCASTNHTAMPQEGSKSHIYAEQRERLLCFEFVGNGSLDNHITDELRGLEWNVRYEIIRGICNGLHYLLNEKSIYHMDLKPANILVDSNMVPKITDFGQSRYDEKSHTLSLKRCGTRGYCPPEYALFGKMSSKSDIYSLGTIIIELVTGGKEIINNNKCNVLRRWRHRWKKTGKETPLAYQQVNKCIEIGLLCQEIDPTKRPHIGKVISDINDMDSTIGQTGNAYESFSQKSPYPEDDMLGIEPLELHFPFELNKEISCSLQLTNDTDSYIAFNIKNNRPLPYCTQPHKGIVPPRSKCSVVITLQPQDKAPHDIQRAKEFSVQSTKVNDGLAVEDITTNMLDEETNHAVDKVNLDVVFDAQIQNKLPNVHQMEVPNSVHQEAHLPTSSSRILPRNPKIEFFNLPIIKDPNQFASEFKKVTDAIHAFYVGDFLSWKFDEVYRCAFILLMHNHGDLLYSAVYTTMASEVQDLGRDLNRHGKNPRVFLNELLAKWHRHSTANSHACDVLMYMDRSFVRTKKKTPVHELGIQLWRDSVVRSDEILPWLIKAMRPAMRPEWRSWDGDAMPAHLIASATFMLKELGDEVYQEVMGVAAPTE